MLFTTTDKDKTFVFSWGNNELGTLGLGDQSDRSIPTVIEPLLERNFTAIACGRQHTLLLEQSGVVYGFGSNERGQLGLGEEIQFLSNPKANHDVTGVRKIFCGAHASAAITSKPRAPPNTDSDENDLYVWGNTYLGEDSEEVKGLAEKIARWPEMKKQKFKSVAFFDEGLLLLSRKSKSALAHTLAQ